MAEPRYTVIIQWSDEDDCYIASLPEWGSLCKAYGNTYEETARNAKEVLELLLDEEGDPGPKPPPKHFLAPAADVVPMPDPLDNPPPRRKPKVALEGRGG